jgi:hypothetical protein
MQQPLTPQQSLEIINQGLGLVSATRDVHLQLQAAQQTLAAFVAEHSAASDASDKRKK